MNTFRFCGRIESVELKWINLLVFTGELHAWMLASWTLHTPWQRDGRSTAPALHGGFGEGLRFGLAYSGSFFLCFGKKNKKEGQDKRILSRSVER